jgi:hypothetical protein
MRKHIKKYTLKFKRWMDFNPPGALSATGWRLFNKEYKEVAPIRYWLTNDFKKIFVYPIKRNASAIKWWILYRTTERYHVVETGLKPGYHEVDTLMLNVNFNILKNFVETELAHRSYWSSEKNNSTWCEKHMPFYRVFFPFRRPDLGLQHLDWASTLDDPSIPPHERSVTQAQDAREIKILYKWWVEDRPNRKKYEHIDYDEQGLGLLGFFDDEFDKNATDYKAHIAAMEEENEKRKEWEEEDQEMLIRLINIRSSLWT